MSVKQIDTTTTTTYGWPGSSNLSESIQAGQILAFPITVTSATTVDLFGVETLGSGSLFKMAVYTDAGNTPGSLVVGPETQTSISVGLVDAADTPIAAGTYWIALRVSGQTLVDSHQTITVRRCESTAVTSFASSWPATFGAATCANASAFGVFVQTFFTP